MNCSMNVRKFRSIDSFVEGANYVTLYRLSFIYLWFCVGIFCNFMKLVFIQFVNGVDKFLYELHEFL